MPSNINYIKGGKNIARSHEVQIDFSHLLLKGGIHKLPRQRREGFAKFLLYYLMLYSKTVYEGRGGRKKSQNPST